MSDLVTRLSAYWRATIHLSGRFYVDACSKVQCGYAGRHDNLCRRTYILSTVNAAPDIRRCKIHTHSGQMAES